MTEVDVPLSFHESRYLGMCQGIGGGGMGGGNGREWKGEGMERDFYVCHLEGNL